MLDRKLLRELAAARWLLAAIAAILAVGTACYVSMQSAWWNLETARRSYYARCRMADFWLDLKKVPVAELDAAAAEIDGVERLEPRISFYAPVELEDEIEPINGLVLSLPDRGEPALNALVMRQGGGFTDRRENEAIVSEAFARRHGLAPGRTVRLLLNNRQQELFLVGTAISSEFTYLLGPGAITPDAEHFGVFYVKQSYAEDVFDMEGAANQAVGSLTPEARAAPDDVLRRLETRLADYGLASATPRKLQASHQFLTGEIEGLGAFASVLPVIFLAVAAAVLNVLLTRLARQQRVTVGTLKALGYGDRTVFFHFLKYGLVVGLAGGVLGDALGYGISEVFTHEYRKHFEFPELPNQFSPSVHVIGLAVAAACALAGSLYAARLMLLLQPAEAMRPEPPGPGGRSLLEAVPWLWTRLSAPWRATLRGLARHKLRTLAGVFAATMGAGLLVTGFMFVEIVNFLVEFQFHRVSRSDVDVVFRDAQPLAALDEVRRLPGVDYAEPTLNVGCTFRHGPYRRKAGIQGLPAGGRLTTPRDSAGDPLSVPSHGLVITTRLAELLHVEPGDELEITPLQGDRRPVTMPVVKIADSFLGLAAYADLEYLSRGIGEPLAITGVQLQVHPDEGRRRELFRELRKLPAVEAVHDRRDLIENLMRTVVDNHLVFLMILIPFAGIIFFGSIVNASLVGLQERQREVATYYALGYSPWAIGGLFLRETLVVNAVGSLLGLPVGYFLTWLTANSYDNDMLRMPVVHQPWVWWTALLLAALFTLLAHAVTQRQILRLNFLEALKVKE